MTFAKDIKALFEQSARLSTDSHGEPVSRDLQLAVAILAVRAGYLDKRFAKEEREEVLRDLTIEFGMDRREAKELVEEAKEIQSFDTWLNTYVEQVRENFDADQRMEVLALVWRVVEADDFVEIREEEFVNSLAVRLGLTPEEESKAKQLAQLSL